MTAEALVKKEIKHGLISRGIWFFMPVQCGYGRTAIDFICCWDGLFLAIEAKAENNKVGVRQQATLTEIKEAGGRAVVAYSWADVEEALERWTSS
jgi:hypothetical protein